MSEYIHGFSESERKRLSQMQDILNQAQLDKMDLSHVSTVLDVGSGLGQMSRSIARRLGNGGTVVAIEKNSVQFESAQKLAAGIGEHDLVQFRQGDATELPLRDDEWNSFDLVHARFLLEHVPDPQLVVEQIVKAVKPGGRIFLMDDDHELLRVWPECHELDMVWRQYWESYRDLGHDPLVGRRMTELLSNAGGKTVEVTSLFYGACNGQALFDAVVDNLIGVIVGASETLINSKRLTSRQLEEFGEVMKGWRSTPYASVWYSLPIVIGTKC